MAMIVQLILLIRRVCVVDDVIVVLIAGEGSSTIADDVRTGGGEHKTMLLSSYPHRYRRHRNNQPRTISTRNAYACVTDYHPQYKQVCKVHCINIVFSSKFGGVGWGTSSEMMLQLLTLHTTTPTRY